MITAVTCVVIFYLVIGLALTLNAIHNGGGWKAARALARREGYPEWLPYFTVGCCIVFWPFFLV